MNYYYIQSDASNLNINDEGILYPRSSKIAESEKAGASEEFLVVVLTRFYRSLQERRTVMQLFAKITTLEAKIARKDEVLGELMDEHIKLKKSWRDLNGQWTPHDVRDDVVDFIKRC